MNSMKYQWH